MDELSGKKPQLVIVDDLEYTPEDDHGVLCVGSDSQRQRIRMNTLQIMAQLAVIGMMDNPVFMGRPMHPMGFNPGYDGPFDRDRPIQPTGHEHAVIDERLAAAQIKRDKKNAKRRKSWNGKE